MNEWYLVKPIKINNFNELLYLKEIKDRYKYNNIVPYLSLLLNGKVDKNGV